MTRFMNSSFLRILVSELREDWRGLLAMTLISGASDTLLIVVVNRSSKDAVAGELSIAHLIMFLSMLAIHALTRYRMLVRSGIAMKNIVYGFRTRICERLTRVELEDFEKMGKPDIQLILGRDIGLLSAPSVHFFSIPATIVTTVLSLLYLGFISPLTFLVVISLNVGYGIYFLDNRLRVAETMTSASEAEGRLFSKITQLSLGFKELKMHRERRRALVMRTLFPLSGEVREVQNTINTQLSGIFATSDVFYYLAVGVTLFILPSMQVLLGTAASSTITVMIFLFGNVNEILFAFSILLQYDGAIDRLKALEQKLDCPIPDENSPENIRLKMETSFEVLQLSGCAFSYHDSLGKRVFTVGPIDLTIPRGEVLFIVGGNGSGKSTFLRMLCGLYLPSEGVLSLNGVPIGTSNVDTFRQYFSTIFNDFHLFDQFYGLETVTEDQVRALQRRFMLDEKTLFHDHHFSTLDLSTGQRKRLALLTAMLEDRPILILDEVSADQDPEFRRFYYEELLAELKSQGRTVLVVSHDDRYFHVADRVLYMDYGRLDSTPGLEAGTVVAGA